MDMELVLKIALGVIGFFLVEELKFIRKSVEKLNITIAALVEKQNFNESRIDKHDSRIERLEQSRS